MRRAQGRRWLRGASERQLAQRAVHELRERRPATDVLVLCYHAVSENWPAALAVRPNALEHQVRLLLARGYRPTTFSEAVLSRPSPRTLAVTFDDAFRSVAEVAYPILSELGVPGTVFVPTAQVERAGPMCWAGIDAWIGTPYEHELAGCGWDELGALAEAGWEVGSHTRTHPHLTRVGEDALESELRGSREDCERRLGRPCRSIAYPFGDTDAAVATATKQAGYELAAGLPAGRRSPDRWSWPRVGIYRGDDMVRFRLKVSPATRLALRTPASTLLAQARARLT